MLLYSFKPREVPDYKPPEGPFADREILKGKAEDLIAYANVKIKKRYDSIYKL